LSPSECSQSCQAVPEKFIARQPILNVNQDVYAYELLFRSGVENYFSHPDGDQATANSSSTACCSLAWRPSPAGPRPSLTSPAVSCSMAPQPVAPRKDRGGGPRGHKPRPAGVRSLRQTQEGGLHLAWMTTWARNICSPAAIVDVVKIDFLGIPETSAPLAETLAPAGVKTPGRKSRDLPGFPAGPPVRLFTFPGLLLFRAR